MLALMQINHYTDLGQAQDVADANNAMKWCYLSILVHNPDGTFTVNTIADVNTDLTAADFKPLPGQRLVEINTLTLCFLADALNVEPREE